MTVDYLALTRDCTTQNQFNRVHIELEKTITPFEFAAIANTPALPEQAKVWMAKWIGYTPTLASAPEPYLRQDVNSYLTWFRPKRAPDAPRRTLVAFCGNADRPMLPLPVFLQTLPAADWDILRVLRPSRLCVGTDGTAIGNLIAAIRSITSGERQRSYMRPGREVSDLNRTIAAVRSALGKVPPADTTCFGVSAGGAPAIIAALQLGTHRGVMIGGHMPDTLVPLIPRLSGTAKTKPDFLFAFGSGHAHDRTSADRLVTLFGGKQAAFTGIKAHGVLAKVAEQGRLTDVMAGLIGGQPLPPGMIDDAI